MRGLAPTCRPTRKRRQNLKRKGITKEEFKGTYAEVMRKVVKRVQEKSAQPQVIAVTSGWDCAKDYMTKAEWDPMGAAEVIALIKQRVAERSKNTSAPKSETVPITAADMRKVTTDAKREHEDTCYKQIKGGILADAKRRKFVRTGLLPIEAQDALVARLTKEGYAIKLLSTGSTSVEVEIKWD
jgi:hypothetical protein